MVVYDDLTLESALADPMIDLVRRADGIDRRSFAMLLRSAARDTIGVRPERTGSSGDIRAAGAIAATVRKKHCGCVTLTSTR